MMKQGRVTPRLISARELSEYIGVSVSTVYDWVAKGCIPSFRFGRLIRFDLGEIDQWINESRPSQVRKDR